MVVVAQMEPFTHLDLAARIKEGMDSISTTCIWMLLALQGHTALAVNNALGHVPLLRWHVRG